MANYQYGYPQAQYPYAATPATQYGYPQVPIGGQLPPTGGQFPTAGGLPSVANMVPGMLPIEESYIENILRLNKGKIATVYMGFDNKAEPTVFRGVLEAAGRDHIILSDPQTGKRFLLLMVYLNYVTFDEEIEYDYPF